MYLGNKVKPGTWNLSEASQLEVRPQEVPVKNTRPPGGDLVIVLLNGYGRDLIVRYGSLELLHQLGCDLGYIVHRSMSFGHFEELFLSFRFSLPGAVGDSDIFALQRFTHHESPPE
jgi:hypothetical protein